MKINKNKLLLMMISFFTTISSLANVVGLDTQTFNPTGDQLGFVTVQSGKTLKPGILGVSIFMDYSQNSQLVYSLPISNQNQIKHKDQAAGLQAGVAYGLGGNFQFGVSLPFVMMQNPIGDQQRSVTVTKGLNSLKLYGKWNFYDTRDYGSWAFIAAEDFPNVQNDPITGLNPSPVTDFELAWSTLTSSFNSLGANVGYRIRKPGTIPDNASMFPVGDQFIYSLGFGTPINEDRSRRLVLELYGASLAPNNSSNSLYKNPQDASTFEFLAAIKTQIGQRQFLTYGATAALNQPGIGADWRIFVGYNFYFAPGKSNTVPTNDPLLWSQNASSTKYAPPSLNNDDDGNSNNNNAIDQSVIDDLIHSSNQNSTPKTDTETDFMKVKKQHITQDITGEMEKDSDNDGVPDSIDKCPNTPLGATVNKWGCEVVSAKNGGIQPKPQESFVLEDVLFEFNKSELSVLAYPILDKLSLKLKKKKYKTIQIIGHADSIGKDKYNFLLSLKRARTVRLYLISKGIDPMFLRIRGKGKSEPIATNKTEEGRQRNRRVVINMFKNELQ